MSDLDTKRESVHKMLQTVNLKSDEAWTKNEFVVKQWLDAFKKWEQDETFKRAFDDDRMTIRGMGVQQKHKEAVDQEMAKMKLATGFTPKLTETEKQNAYVRGAVGTFSRAESNITNMHLYYGVKGILERAKPANFKSEPEGYSGIAKNVYGAAAANQREAGWSRKYWMGLHDLSASLLKGGGERLITEQRKWYTDSTWVFMPIPTQDDMVLFNCLNEASKEQGASPQFRQYVRLIAGQMTRLKMAESTDMHTTYIDTGDVHALYPKQGKIKYGLQGLDDHQKVDEKVVKKRKENALHYKRILSATKSDVNEVVIAYREHGNGKTMFPMFATQQNENSDYVVIDRNKLIPLGPKITIKGEWKPS